jgi:tetratricopeptide (TPR) repeat protein
MHHPLLRLHLVRPTLTALLAGFFTAACAGPLAQAPTPEGGAAQPAPSSVPSSATPATAPAVASSDMDGELFFQLLVSEIQLGAGDPGGAYSLVLDAARRTNRAELYGRAVDIALQARSGDAALTAARAWADAFPSDTEPHRYVLQILLALNRPAELANTLGRLIELTPPPERPGLIQAIPQTLARTSDKAAALAAAQQALAPTLAASAPGSTRAAALTAIGRMQLANEQPDAALASARNAATAEPHYPAAALLALELMGQGRAEAEPLVLAHLERTSGRSAPAVQMGYARWLLDQQRYADASLRLETLTTQAPSLADPWLLLGSLQVQENRLEQAQTSLDQYLTLSRELPAEQASRGQTQAFLLLSQIAERRGDFAAANAWLDRIENADELIAAQLRRAMLLARQGQLKQARELLQGLPERDEDDARRKLTAEAQLLREMGEFKEALALYAKAVERFPNDPDLVYEKAMAAEKAGDLPQLERLLRGLIQSHPDYHHAYNALGYTLADRNERLPEAKALIMKALEFAPGDPYIQDSLGWVQYRMGMLPEALATLQGAYARRPDAEIAAHLGEVHWGLGQREQALRIWREGLLLNPQNQTLIETLKRFNVRP